MCWGQAGLLSGKSGPRISERFFSLLGHGLDWGRTSPDQGEACVQPDGCVGTKWLTIGHFVSLALPVGKPVVTSCPHLTTLLERRNKKQTDQKNPTTQPKKTPNKQKQKEVGKVFNSSPTLPGRAAPYSTIQRRVSTGRQRGIRSQKKAADSPKKHLERTACHWKAKENDTCQTSHEDKLLLTSHRPGEPLRKARPTVIPDSRSWS